LQQYYSAKKAQDALAMPQTPIESAIKECIDWYSENGILTK
jgi:dTDP-D-glucose 4,6-dehydratase